MNLSDSHWTEATIAPVVEQTAARLRAWGIQSPKAELMAADLVAVVLRAALGEDR
jgi:hypothetical protein